MSVRQIYHILVSAQYAYGCYYDWVYVNLPPKFNLLPSIGKLQYLTYWCALIQTFYFIISTLNDFFGTNDNVPPAKVVGVRKLRDLLLTGLAFPLAMFVGITFWGIYFVDRELILPKSMDPYFPHWLNHVMHTNIMVTAIIELCSSVRVYPPRKTGIGLLAVVMVIYLIWIHVMHSLSGLWVYPILNVLSLQMRIVFFASLLLLSVALYILGETINECFWRKELNMRWKKGSALQKKIS